MFIYLKSPNTPCTLLFGREVELFFRIPSYRRNNQAVFQEASDARSLPSSSFGIHSDEPVVFNSVLYVTALRRFEVSETALPRGSMCSVCPHEKHKHAGNPFYPRAHIHTHTHPTVLTSKSVCCASRHTCTHTCTYGFMHSVNTKCSPVAAAAGLMK